MTEQWTRWEPIPGLSGKYYVESISDNMEGFEILLVDANDKKKKAKVQFEYSPDSYQRTKRKYKSKLFSDLATQYGENFCNWTFFQVTNSSYIQLLSEESYGISDDRSFIHLALLAADSVVDILAGYQPTVQLVESE